MQPKRWITARRMALAAIASLCLLGARRAAPAQGQTVRPAVHIDSVVQGSARMGEPIQIRTRGMRAAQQAGTNPLDPKKLVLFLDGRAMKGVGVVPVGSSGELWEARLRRTDGARDAWISLLGSPREPVRKNVRVSLGLEDQPEFPSTARFDLVIVRPFLFWAAVALWIALLWAFWRLAKRTPVLRDSVPADRPWSERPYSLGRSQMAFWLFLVSAAFLGIWLITGEYRGIVSAEALLLLGIGTGTALGARAIEQGKRDTQQAAERRQAELAVTAATLDRELASPIAALPPGEAARLTTELAETRGRLAAVIADPGTPVSPTTRKFLYDILSDGDGMAFHRFQILVWTLILGAVFVVGTYRTLAMPQFDDTLLALLGISGGTYLGFKLSEPRT